MHIQLTDGVWQTEERWKNDKSVKGKLKYRCGLHCFGRSEKECVEIVTRHEFSEIKIENIEDFIQEKSDELHSQRLLIAYKKIELFYGRISFNITINRLKLRIDEF